MTRLMIAALLVSAPLLCNAEASLKYDRFKDRLEISAGSKGPALDRWQLVWLAAASGETLTARPPFMRLMILTSSKTWEYLKCYDVNFLADGKPVAVENTKHDGHVGRGYVLESIYATVTPKALDQLAAAQKVEMRMCRTEYTFDATDMQDVRDFAAATTPKR